MTEHTHDIEKMVYAHDKDIALAQQNIDITKKDISEIKEHVRKLYDNNTDMKLKFGEMKEQFTQVAADVKMLVKDDRGRISFFASLSLIQKILFGITAIVANTLIAGICAFIFTEVSKRLSS